MITYEDSGVDISAGYDLVSRIGPAVVETHTEHVLPNFGSFNAMYRLPTGYRDPILVSSSDGVGTKVKLAHEYKFNSTIGQDLVAMSVNDLVCCGAKPMFFQDYFATGKLDVDVAEMVVKGIAEACILANCSLVGGETAEMPGVYQPNDYDMAGFAVGIVEHDKIIDGSKIEADDVLLGIRSSGFHSNGYSLIRKLIEADPSLMDLKRQTRQAIVAPTIIYVDAIMGLVQRNLLKGAAHITGGGIVENLPRMLKLAEGVKARIDPRTIIEDMPPAFKEIQAAAKLDDMQMLNTFNCGIGMIVAVSPKYVHEARQNLLTNGYSSGIVGHILHKG